MPGVVLAPTRSGPASPLEAAPTASRARETVEGLERAQPVEIHS
jgi:hypothetical protein